MHQSRSPRILLPVATALLAVCIGLLSWLILLDHRTDSSVWQTIPLTSLLGSENFPSFSPDGKLIAYVWANDEDGINSSIYIKMIGAETQLRLTHGLGADFVPHWSPDGRYIAFCREAPGSTGVYIISALGGPERRITSLDSCGNLDWLPGGQRLVVSNLIAKTRWIAGNTYPLFLVTVDTGERRPLTSPPMGTLGDASPLVSPDGTTLAFVRLMAAEAADIYVTPLGGGALRRLTFDGQAKLGIAWTSDSREIVFASSHQGSFRLWRIALRGGEPRPITSGGEDSYSPAIARSGNRLAYTVARNDINLWCIGISGSTPLKVGPATRLISSNRVQTDAQFSPDSRKIAFKSGRSGPNEIWVSDADGEQMEQLTHIGSSSGSPRWSPDGSQIAFDSRPYGNPDIFVIRADGGMPRRLTTNPAEDVVPSWSYDRKWIYFASNRTGQFQIWKVPARTGESLGAPAVQVTRHGGYNAFESPDGKYLYFAKGPAKPGLWRLGLNGGNDSPEEPVLESLDQWSWWTLSSDGIYFFKKVEQPAEAQHATIALELFNLQSRRISRLALLHKPVGSLVLLC
jgi:Tol biopolymer transport system component